MDKYIFTYKQLRELLFHTIAMYREYLDEHGHEDAGARAIAVEEMFDGLQADRDLVEMGEQDELKFQAE